MSKYEVHIMKKKPFQQGFFRGEIWAIHKSRCGIAEPKGQAYGALKPTCKKCIKIEAAADAAGATE